MQWECWDTLNGTRDDAIVVEAGSALLAAEAYAARDVDGQVDGLYFDTPQPIAVAARGDPRVVVFDVSAEVSEVRYHARAARHTDPDDLRDRLRDIDRKREST